MFRFPALLLTLLAAVPAAAQPAPPIDCAKAASTPEINWCEGRAFDRADRALNAAYSAYLKRVDASDLDDTTKGAWRKAVGDAQRRWIAFRDADCDGAVAFDWYGGTGATAAVLGCKRTLTEARTKDIRARTDR